MIRRRIPVSTIACLLALCSSAPRALAENRPGTEPQVLLWRVARTGLSVDEGRRLAQSFGVPSSLNGDGEFMFVGDTFGNVPTTTPTTTPSAAPGGSSASVVTRREEDGRATTASSPDLSAIRRLAPPSDAEISRSVPGKIAAAGLQIPGPNSMEVLHSELSFDLDDGSGFSSKIDTTARFRFNLDGIPLEGPGMRLRATFAPGGAVTELQWATRNLERGPSVALLPSESARGRCAQHYPPGSTILSPRLVYWAPPLVERVGSIYPYWECQGTGPDGELLVTGLILALKVPPTVTISVATNVDQVNATASTAGFTPPLTYSWASMTTKIPSPNSSQVSYKILPREPVAQETLLLTVKDANGVKVDAQSTFTVQTNTLIALFAPPSLAVGGEFNVYEWGCVQASSDGFQSAFDAHSVAVPFRWNGLNAWERDFKQTGGTTNGDDGSFIDNVDLAWYTGHGAPGKFTFGNTTHDDSKIVPADARYGDGDLEWLQLESCNVLADPDGNGVSAADRWGGVFDGLHMLNGFHTTASCVANTAGTFSSYLFTPKKIRQAWASMATSLEPAGKVYVSMGPIRSGDLVWNFDDYFWNQGAVGPDIPASQSIGLWTLKATV